MNPTLGNKIITQSYHTYREFQKDRSILTYNVDREKKHHNHNLKSHPQYLSFAF